MSENEAAVKYKTCRLTIVTPGYSDQVLDIYPAEHEAETVWMNKRAGMDRWEEIQRTLSQGTPHTRAVPKAAPWHGPGERLLQPTLKEADIPKAELENGVVLLAPAEEERPKHNFSSTAQKQERNVEALIKANEALIESQKKNEEQINALMEKLAEKELAEEGGERVTCPIDGCEKSFAREKTLNTHMEKFHK